MTIYDTLPLIVPMSIVLGIMYYDLFTSKHELFRDVNDK